MAPAGGASRRVRDWWRGPDEEAVVLARATVKGRAVVEDAAPESFQVARGTEVHLKFLYDLEEASTDREEYRFLLRVWTGRLELPPGLARWGDAWGVPERRKGFVEVRVGPLEPGRHRVRYEASAEYVQRPWRGGGTVGFHREGVDGSLDLLVE